MIFWQAATNHGVHCLLLDQAIRTGADASWPEAAREAGRRVLANHIAAELLRERELRLALERLAADGVECLLLKGVAIGRTHYSAPHLRPRADADLLIRARDIDRTRAILEAAGYARATEAPGETISSQFHFDRVAAPSGLHALDVHWKVANPQVFADAIGFDALVEGAVSVPGLGPHARAPSAPNALVLACMHRIAHHDDADTLLWLWDIHLLVTRLTTAEAEQFLATAAAARLRAVCARSLFRTAEQFHTPGAQALAERLTPAPGDPVEPSSRFVGGGLRLVDIVRADLATLGWRGRAAIVREHLFPPLAYMRVRYKGWPAVCLPFAYAYRIASGAPKWFRRG